MLVLVVWVAAHAIALWSPALEPSMAGKRDGCSIEVLLLGAPAFALGLLAARRLAPLDRALTGALIGAAAAAAPALLMQFACMYLPAHALSHHLAPMLIPIVLGAALGPTALRRI